MKSKEILFSVVCPTFNRSKLLRRAINSVLRQQFRNFELIIVNDGSTDDTKDVVKSYNDERIIYLEHEKNKGLNAAINTGFLIGKGKYITKLDDDDELSESALQTAFDVYDKLPSSNIKILFFNCVDAETKFVSGKYLQGETIIKYEDLLCQKLRGDYWVVVERSILPHGRILDEYSWGAMGVLWLRLLRDCDAYYLPQIVYYAYREHGTQRLTNFEASRRNWQIHEHTTRLLLEEFGKDMKSNCPDIYSKQVAALAFCQLWNKNSRTARLNLIFSLERNFSIYASGLLLLTFFWNEKIILLLYRLLFKSYFGRTLF